MPIYIVTVKRGRDQTPRIVRANNRSQALRHVAQEQFAAAVANADTVADLMEAGVKVERAGADEDARLE